MEARVIGWRWLVNNTISFAFKGATLVYKAVGAVRSESRFKGTMSTEVHARVDKKDFGIVGPTLSNTVRESRKLFSCVWITFIFSNYTSCLLRYFGKLLQLRKSKNPVTSCMQTSLNRALLRICKYEQRGYSYLPCGCDACSLGLTYETMTSREQQH